MYDDSFQSGAHAYRRDITKPFFIPFRSLPDDLQYLITRVRVRVYDTIRL